MGAPTLIVTLLAAAPVPDAPDAADAPRARISFLEGELGGQAEPGEDEEEGARLTYTLSSMVLPGDRLDAEMGARVEIELPGGNFLRLSGGASIILQRFDGDVDVTLIDGAVYASGGSGAPAIAISTEGARVVVDGGAMLRAELWAGQGRLEVRAVRGPAGVDTGGATRKLEQGERLVQSRADVEVAKVSGGKDDFDRWNEERERTVRTVSVPAPLAGERYDGLWALEGHGRWVYLDDGWYWGPTVVETWAPYSDGYWTWYGSFGWTWIPGAPWGYVTHHYGRWAWFPRHGWVWRPHRGWRGAWVAWAHSGPHLGWAPCDEHGHAVPHARWSFTRPSTFASASSRRHAPRAPITYTLPTEELSRGRLVEIEQPDRDLAPPGDKRAGGPTFRRLLAEERRHTAPREGSFAPPILDNPARFLPPRQGRELVPPRDAAPPSVVAPPRVSAPSAPLLRPPAPALRAPIETHGPSKREAARPPVIRAPSVPPPVVRPMAPAPLPPPMRPIPPPAMPQAREGNDRDKRAAPAAPPPPPPPIPLPSPQGHGKKHGSERNK